jgi:hypothetical protein
MTVGLNETDPALSTYRGLALAARIATLRPAGCCASLLRSKKHQGLSMAAHGEDTTMAWTSPTLVEIGVGLEINGYLPAEF